MKPNFIMRLLASACLALMLTACHKDDHAPGGPELTDVAIHVPSDGAVGIHPGKMSFAWKHPGGVDIRFQVLYSADRGATWQSSGLLTDTCFVPATGSLKTGTIYQWMVVTRWGTKQHTGGVHEFTTLRQFRTGDVETYAYNGAGMPTVVILGDGFTTEDLMEEGAYQTTARKMLDYLFSVEPYKTYKDCFNAYICYTESKHRGALRGSKPALGEPTRDNPSATGPDYLKDTYFAASIDSYGLNAFKDSCYNCAGRIPGIDLDRATVALLVNENSFSGMTWPGSGDRAIAMSTLPPDDPERGAFNTFIHEFSHGFAKLADEYEGYEGPPAQSVRDALAQDHLAGRNLNVSHTDDPEQVPWKHFLKIDRYTNASYQPVGVFEGGYTYRLGIYRSEYSSCMGAKMYSYFNAISREMIVKRIMKILEKPYSFDEFLAKDKIVPSSSVVVPSIRIEDKFEY